MWTGNWLTAHFLVPGDQPMALLGWSEAPPLHCLFSHRSTEVSVTWLEAVTVGRKCRINVN